MDKSEKTERSRLDEAVSVACGVLAEHALDGDGPSGNAMRDALLAALPVLLGEPVAWQYLSRAGDREWIGCGKNLADTFAKHGHAIRPLYAPSLGEGHE